MDKRFLVALLLSAVIIGVTPWIFPTPKTAPPATAVAPETRAVATPSVQPTTASPAVTAPAIQGPAVGPALPQGTAATVTPADTIFISTPKVEYGFTALGAAPVFVGVKAYPSQRNPKQSVALTSGRLPLLRFRLISGRDTLRLDQTVFSSSRSTARDGSELLEFSANAGSAAVRIRYTIDTAGYASHVAGNVVGGVEPTFLLIDLPTTLPSAESDTIQDLSHLAYAFKPRNDNASSIAFRKLDPGEAKLERGPLTWAAVKNKYFVLGVLEAKGLPAFSEVVFVGGPRSSKIVTEASATVVQSVKNGAFGFDMYAGPQEWKQLIAMGNDFDHVNPYGWSFMRGIVQPVAALVIQSLLWMHQVLKLSYGWVLVIFGVAIRFLLWPLNQKAMRSQMKLQEMQPRLQEVQKRYQNNPEKQREEIMKVYRDSGSSPLAPLAGCLPMLIPMPIFFALFFVFQNTIEFRGVPFLWLTDISVKDPFYILPLLMGISMFLLSWVGMRNSPPNPQAKMMGYVFPVMMTVMLANMASGLNLYYTAQNFAAIPQQWLIAKERGKQKVPAK
jgi:YidC/Oxa1 family membrane protein insertase